MKKGSKLFLFIFTLLGLITFREGVKALQLTTSTRMCRTSNGSYEVCDNNSTWSSFNEKKFDDVNAYCVSGWATEAPPAETECSAIAESEINILYAHIIKYAQDKGDKSGYALWYFIEDIFDRQAGRTVEPEDQNKSEESDLTNASNNAVIDEAIYNKTNASVSARTVNLQKNGNNYTGQVNITGDKISEITCTFNGVTGVATNNNGTINISVPAANITSDVTATLNCAVKQTYLTTTVYSCGNYQQLAVQPTNAPQTTDIPITVKISASIKVSISKTDATGKKELPGAKLSILDADGKVLKKCIFDNDNNLITYSDSAEAKACSWISTEHEKEVEGLPVGKYYLVEDQAPSGYVKSTEKILIEITENGAVKDKYIMKNALEVKVPNTLSARSTLLLIVAMIDIALGIGIVTYVKKLKTEK